MSNNPFESPDEACQTSEPTKKRRSILGFIGRVALLVAVGLLLIALFVPLRRGTAVRHTALRNGCLNNLRQIMRAVLTYEAAHGTLPPAYTVDTEGNHSEVITAVFLDNHTQSLPLDLSEGQWQALLTIAGREPAVE